MRVWPCRAGDPVPGVAQGARGLLVQVISAGDWFGGMMGTLLRGSWGCGDAGMRLGQTGEGWGAQIRQGGGQGVPCLLNGVMSWQHSESKAEEGGGKPSKWECGGA